MSNSGYPLLMIDLFSGLGGASRAMAERGWEVVRVDNNQKFKPTVLIDIHRFSWKGRRPDLIWASPPCQEFARWIMPWFPKSEPSLDLVKEAIRVIEECKPRFWVIENVRGAISWFKPLLGNYKVHYGPIFLWGNFPDLGDLQLGKGWKMKISGRYPEKKRQLFPMRLARLWLVQLNKSC